MGIDLVHWNSKNQILLHALGYAVQKCPIVEAKSWRPSRDSQLTKTGATSVSITRLVLLWLLSISVHLRLGAGHTEIEIIAVPSQLSQSLTD